MKYYTYDVTQGTNAEGQEVWEVIETPTSGDGYSVLSVHNNENDARIAARYNKEFQEYGNHILACMATGKWMTMNGIRPVSIHISFFDTNLGIVNTAQAFEALWRSM